MARNQQSSLLCADLSHCEPACRRGCTVTGRLGSGREHHRCTNGGASCVLIAVLLMRRLHLAGVGLCVACVWCLPVSPMRRLLCGAGVANRWSGTLRMPAACAPEHACRLVRVCVCPLPKRVVQPGRMRRLLAQVRHDPCGSACMRAALCVGDSRAGAAAALRQVRFAA